MAPVGVQFDAAALSDQGAENPLYFAFKAVEGQVEAPVLVEIPQRQRQVAQNVEPSPFRQPPRLAEVIRHARPGLIVLLGHHVLLDEADPIEGSYTLEVGSAGAERALKRPADFARFMGSPVLVKLYRNLDGRKEFAGTLAAYDEQSGDVTVTVGKSDMTFPKKDVALVRLRVEF